MANRQAVLLHHSKLCRVRKVKGGPGGLEVDSSKYIGWRGVSCGNGGFWVFPWASSSHSRQHPPHLIGAGGGVVLVTRGGLPERREPTFMQNVGTCKYTRYLADVCFVGYTTSSTGLHCTHSKVTLLVGGQHHTHIPLVTPHHAASSSCPSLGRTSCDLVRRTMYTVVSRHVLGGDLCTLGTIRASITGCSKHRSGQMWYQNVRSS